MAQFMATIQGNRGEASRLGSKDSGISAKINGWDAGISVEAWYDQATEEDYFRVYQTGGSNGHTPKVFLGELRGGKFFPNGDKI